MIRRSFNIRFRETILKEIKTTTIRNNPWPIGKPIMAFNWVAVPYKSKQADISPIIVTETASIHIQNTGDRMIYRPCPLFVTRLWYSEGFLMPSEMDEWFSNLVKPGRTITMHIMRFRIAHELNTTAPLSA